MARLTRGSAAVGSKWLPLVVSITNACSAGSQNPPGDVVGDLRLHSFESRVFRNTRMLRVWLPPGYDAVENQSKVYPVLFLNDGQNLFDSATATLNPIEWRVDETLTTLIRRGQLQPMIVVGIDNAGRRGRFREYFPYVDEYLQPPEPDPQGTRYPEFLVDEVIPFVEARYRIAREPARRGIGGSSAGALAAIYSVIARPGAFGKLLAESPSIYVDDFHVLKDAAAVKQWPERIYLAAGTNEGGRPNCDPSTAEPELVRDIKRFQQLLLDAGVASHRIKLTIAECAVHNEAAWAARLPHALTFLFGDAPSEPRPAPWSQAAISRADVPDVYTEQWQKAENRASCALIAFSDLGQGSSARARAATFSGGWAVAYDLPELRSAFGVAGTGVAPGPNTYDEWPHRMRWADASSAGYGPEGGSGPNQLAYLRIAGQDCLYNVWSRLGVAHLEQLLQSLRFVQ